MHKLVTILYSYNKSQRDALFLYFVLVKVLYMFRRDLLSIIRSFNTVYTVIGICHASYVDCLVGFYYKNMSRCTVLWISN